MKTKLFLLLALVAVVASGCSVKYNTPDGPRRYTFVQRGIMLMVTHTCTEHWRLHQAGRGLIADIVSNEPYNIPLEPISSLIGLQYNHAPIQVTVQSIDPKGKIVGTHSQTFHVDQYATTGQTWIISDDRTGFGGAGMRSYCKQ